MNILPLSKKEYSRVEPFGVSVKPSGQQHYPVSSFIKQKMHERKIDEFFLTDFDAPHKRTSILAVMGSIAGVAIPAILYARKHHAGLKLGLTDILKKSVNLEYSLNEILAVGLGGVAGGLLGGLADKKEKDKLKKMEEAFFQVMNITFPAVLVDQSMKLCNKKQSFNNTFARIALTALSIIIGAGSAVKIANATDDYVFDKYNHDKERKFKKKDLIVHVDDLFGSLVLTKMPFAQKLHINKILPAIYAWCGYHVGDY